MGTASYTGLSSGIYVDPTGAVFVQGAKMQSTVDFGPARSVAFSTTDTTLAPLNPAIPVTPVSVPALNLTGNLSIASGSNQFSGSVTAPGTPALAGTATGRFYGPTAQEIGGVFSLKGTGPQTMLGGFGGKQP
jgi:C-lobe and N-lobe beta barrels of Tf-binding protein B